MDIAKPNFINSGKIRFLRGFLTVFIPLAAILLYLSLLDFQTPLGPPGCTGFSQIRPIAWKAVESTDTLTVSFSNDAGTKINFINASATVNGLECTAPFLTSKEMRSGEIHEVNASGCNIPEKGEDYNASINILYTHTASEKKYSSSGECHGKAE